MSDTADLLAAAIGEAYPDPDHDDSASHRGMARDILATPSGQKLLFGDDRPDGCTHVCEGGHFDGDDMTMNELGRMYTVGTDNREEWHVNGCSYAAGGWRRHGDDPACVKARAALAAPDMSDTRSFWESVGHGMGSVSLTFGPNPERGGIREVVTANRFILLYEDQFGTRTLVHQGSERLRHAIVDDMQAYLDDADTGEAK
jgi:hypothetical protein